MREAALLAARVLYLFAPLLVAAAVSGVVLRLNLFAHLRRPIDGGATFRGRRVFGDNKTWRGVIVAVAACIVTAAAQRLLAGRLPGVELIDYATANPLLLGAAIGGGAMLGELPNSFVKRQIGIAPGAPASGPWSAVFYVWDQIDLVTTSWPLLAFWLRPTLPLVAASIVLALALHPTVSLIGYLTGARKTAR
jgi:hypothetical protein